MALSAYIRNLEFIKFRNDDYESNYGVACLNFVSLVIAPDLRRFYEL